MTFGTGIAIAGSALAAAATLTFAPDGAKTLGHAAVLGLLTLVLVGIYRIIRLD